MLADLIRARPQAELLRLRDRQGIHESTSWPLQGQDLDDLEREVRNLALEWIDNGGRPQAIVEGPKGTHLVAQTIGRHPSSATESPAAGASPALRDVVQAPMPAADAHAIELARDVVDGARAREAALDERERDLRARDARVIELERESLARIAEREADLVRRERDAAAAERQAHRELAERVEERWKSLFEVHLQAEERGKLVRTSLEMATTFGKQLVDTTSAIGEMAAAVATAKLDQAEAEALAARTQDPVGQTIETIAGAVQQVAAMDAGLPPELAAALQDASVKERLRKPGLRAWLTRPGSTQQLVELLDTLTEDPPA